MALRGGCQGAAPPDRSPCSSFAVAAEHVDDLVANHVADAGAGVGEVLAGVKVIGMLGHMLADLGVDLFAEEVDR